MTISILLLAGCGDVVSPAPEGARSSSLGFPGKAIQRKAYIVTLAPSTDAVRVAREHGIETTHVFTEILNGFAGSISDAARTGLLRDSRVVRIDPERRFYTEDAAGRSALDAGRNAVSAMSASETASSWGLDRIDQRTSSLDGFYRYDATGEGVTVYVVDTGIRYSHEDFGGRAGFGFDAWSDDGSDCHGHGTHVAGTVGGSQYGVAKAVRLVSVRVMNCAGSGTTSSVAAGLDWILANARRPAVVNMSVIGDPDDVVDMAVERLVASGIPVVAAAGNTNSDACQYSPARVPAAMTIGATSVYDNRASFSNYGACVDWYAPGLGINSNSNESDSGIVMMSGTSMAAPHVAGAVALYLDRNPGSTPADIAAGVTASASPVVDTREKGSRNGLLVYTLGEASSSNTPPRAAFSATCSTFSCSFADGSSDSDGTVAGWSWDFGDGTSSTHPSPTHIYAWPGTYLVSLTVRDDDGATGTTQQQVTVTAEESPNRPPTSSFTFSCTRLSCSFADASSDMDGSVVRWEWDYGDGTSAVGTAGTGSHSFRTGGRYSVNLTVTDNGGATDVSTHLVPVGIFLTTTGYRQKGQNYVDIQWTGAEAGRVDIYQGPTKLATVAAADGRYTQKVGKHGQATYDFQVCEEGTNYCSAIVTTKL